MEISLDNQYMWYYVDGKLLVETPVVTGNIAAGDDTRRGCFRIASMTTDTYLVGPTWNDHVEYWMPFDDQIGLHDSSWRTEYGGDIYLTDGLARLRQHAARRHCDDLQQHHRRHARGRVLMLYAVRYCKTG